MKFSNHYFNEEHEDEYEIDMKVTSETDDPYSYTSVNIGGELESEIIKFGKSIPDDIIFDEEGFGREEDNHITLLFGMHDDDDTNLKEQLNDVEPFEVQLGDISFFESDGYRVMKIDVISEDLIALHDKLRLNLENTQTFDEYNPHVTIAYVKSHYNDKELDKQIFNGKTATINEVHFQDKDRHPSTIPLR